MFLQLKMLVWYERVVLQLLVDRKLLQVSHRWAHNSRLEFLAQPSQIQQLIQYFLHLKTEQNRLSDELDLLLQLSWTCNINISCCL